MTHTGAQTAISIELDRRIALEALILNRLQKLPTHRQQEWLRGLLVDGFRLACHALRLSSARDTLSASSTVQRTVNAAERSSAAVGSPVAAGETVEATFSAGEGVGLGEPKPFAGLRKVIG